MKKKAIIISAVSVVVIAILIGAFFIVRAIMFRPVNIEFPFESDGTTHTVIFDSRGGSAVNGVTVTDGNPVRRPDNPTKDGYSFGGWQKTEEENSEEWNFATDRVRGDITLYARWIPIGQTAEPTASLTYERNETGYTVTGAGQEEIIVIPAAYEGLPVTEIGERAFSYAGHTAAITAVTIPDTVRVIGLNAFHNRAELVAVNIGEGSALAEIGRNAFSGNSSLAAFYVPAGLTTIGDGAFNNCGALVTITVAAANSVYSGEGNNLIEREIGRLIRGSNSSVIPASVTEIAPAAFRKASGMTELAVPISVTAIGNYFVADSSIKTIRYAGTAEQWNAVTKTSMWNYGNREVEVICGT